MGKPKCSVEGCARDARTRGMCNSHYTFAKRKGWIGPAPVVDKRQELLDAMPGTRQQLAERVGLSRDRVQELILELRAAGLARVYAHLAPSIPGQPWIEVISRGSVDKELDPERKRKHVLRGYRTRNKRKWAAHLKKLKQEREEKRQRMFDEPHRIFVRQWEPLSIKPQNPFSALGV